MSKPTSGVELKKALKETVRETLQEQPAWFHEIVAEALEQVALARAVREGRQTKRVSRAEVFRILDAK